MKRSDKTIAVLGATAAIAGIAYGIPAIANAAATPSPAPSVSTAAHKAPDMGPHLGREQELSGSTAAKVKAAVLAKLPGARVERMSAEDASEGTGAAYEAHVVKSDGTRVEVLLDKSFTVKSVNADRGFGGRGRHGSPGTPAPEGSTSSSGADSSGPAGVITA